MVKPVLCVHNLYLSLQPQYVFIHDALLEAIECGDTEVAARDLKAQYRCVAHRHCKPITHLYIVFYRKLSSASEGNPTKRLIEDEFKVL